MTAITVFIIDDDPGVRTSLYLLLSSAHIASESFASAEDFLRACGPHMQGCLILDVRMQGMSGPQLQEELIRRKVELPIIFLTGYADVGVAVGAMRAGAIDFLPKPINGGLLLQRVQSALAQQVAQQQAALQRAAWQARMAKLTQRERQVLALTLQGMVAKDIASALDISVRTIEGHRARIYVKSDVTSIMELVHAATQAHCSMPELLACLNTPTE